MWHSLPEGALYHETNAYLKSEEERVNMEERRAEFSLAPPKMAFARSAQ